MTLNLAQITPHLRLYLSYSVIPVSISSHLSGLYYFDSGIESFSYLIMSTLFDLIFGLLDFEVFKFHFNLIGKMRANLKVIIEPNYHSFLNKSNFSG